MRGGGAKPGEAGGISFLLLAQAIMQFSTLLLTAGMAILILAALGYVSGSKKIPLVPILVVVPLLGILHNGKAAMRDVYWDAETNERTQVALLDLPAPPPADEVLEARARQYVRRYGATGSLL